MGFIDTLMGKTKMESLEEFEKDVLNALKEMEKKKDPKLEYKMKKNLIKFFKKLYKEGIEVYLDKKDGGQMITKLEDIENISLNNIYKRYVLKTLKEVNKEIDRRLKENEKRKR